MLPPPLLPSSYFTIISFRLECNKGLHPTELPDCMGALTMGGRLDNGIESVFLHVLVAASVGARESPVR